jgi:hypothetical protein
MSQLTSLLNDINELDGIDNNINNSNINNNNSNNFINTNNQESEIKLFDVNLFIDELEKKSEERNKEIQLNSNTISSYDIAHNCIRQILFKIRNAPVTSYKNNWLPVVYRTVLGTATHDFIQQSKQFTELEVSIKAPSLNVSCRLDALIGDSVVVEIKSCTFSDYNKIIKSKKPRDGDFYQALLYKWLLENHLEEMKAQTQVRTQVPKLDKYNIKYIQLIYLAHDLVASECNSMSECEKINAQLKKLLNSKYNPFYFITTINIDLEKIDVPLYEQYIVDKILEINSFLTNKQLPDMKNRFISSKSCFFCLYKNICSQYQ